MSGCATCGGFGDRHDPIAHWAEVAPGRMTHDDIAEIAFNVILICRERGITDPLRQAHAIAVALLKVAEEES